jgi:spoIIIJ-associated protein
VSQCDNAVAEPSGSASDQHAGERDAGELMGAQVAYSPAGERGGPVASDPAAPAGAGAHEAGAAEAADADAAPGVDTRDRDADTAAELDGGVIGSAEARDGGGDDDEGADDDSAGNDEIGNDEIGNDEIGNDEIGNRANARTRDEDGSGDVADLELEGEIAADYVEGLLDVADLDGDIDMDVEGDRALVSVVGATLDELVGPRGEVLEALQELTRLAVHRQTGVRTRIMLDVGGYRLRRRAELAEAGREVAEEVRETGSPKKMWAMNRFERKIVHDAVAAAGLRSESEGDEPDRKVVVLPAD